MKNVRKRGLKSNFDMMYTTCGIKVGAAQGVSCLDAADSADHSALPIVVVPDASPNQSCTDNFVLIQFVKKRQGRLLLLGKTSSPFGIGGGNVDGHLPALLLFGVPQKATTRDGRAIEHREFAATVDIGAESRTVLHFIWAGANAAIQLELPDSGFDTESLADRITRVSLWAILRFVEPFSMEWHRMFVHISPGLFSEAEWRGISLPEQRARESLLKFLPRYNPGKWQGAIDGFDGFCVTGWSMPEDRGHDAINIYLDDNLAGEAIRPGDYREDVREAGFGDGNYGFRLDVPQAARNGSVVSFRLEDAENGTVLDFRFFQYPYSDLKFNGCLENLAPAIQGWYIAANRPDTLVEAELYIDDIFFSTITNGLKRNDLRKRRITNGIGGFEAPSPIEMMARGTHTVRLEFPGGAGRLESSIDSSGCKPAPLPSLSILDKPLNVIIPFYNDPLLEGCLESISRYTSSEVEIVIVDDCSPLPAVSITDKFRDRLRLRVIKNEDNLGFAGAVNRGLAATSGDVVILNADARVTPGWLQSLLLTAASRPKVATVTPMSDKAGVFSAPERGNSNSLPPGCSEEEYARAFRRSSFGLRPVVPTGNGFCMYISRDCLNEIGCLDAEAFDRIYGEENDFCMRALRKGWVNLVDDRTYVFHSRPHSFSNERQELLDKGVMTIMKRYPEYLLALSAFRNKKMKLARFAGKLAAHNWGALCKPRILFVMGVKDGGTPQTNLDLMREFQDTAQCYILECDTLSMNLGIMQAASIVPLYKHQLDEQLEPLSHISAEYDAVVAGWLYELDIELIHIRQLIWQSLNLIPIAKKLGIKTIFSFHDFYPVSPNLNLIDDAGAFRGDEYVEKGTPWRITIWHRSGMGNLPVHDADFREHWKRRFQSYLKFCDALITTSDESRAIVLEEMPELDAEKFFVIPHGRNFDALRNLKKQLGPGEKIRLAVPGNISYHKGRSIIESLAEYDRKHEECLEFHILGTWTGASGANIIRHGTYNREKLGVMIAEIAPHAGFIASVWSETWCHTLTELWACGLPAFVFDFGTQASRMTQSGAGWILPMLDIPELYRHITEICRDETAQSRACAAVWKWQQTWGIANNCALMAARYCQIYSQLLSPLKEKRPIVAACAKDGIATSHLRVMEPSRNDFRRRIVYIHANANQIFAYAKLGLVDGVILQRNLLPKHLVDPAINAMCENSIPYTYEMDDDLFHMPPDKDKTRWYESYKTCLSRQIENATQLMVSTPTLKARYEGHTRAARLWHTRLSRSLWFSRQRKRENDGFIRAFYHGTPTHQEDLLFILPALILQLHFYRALFIVANLSIELMLPAPI